MRITATARVQIYGTTLLLLQPGLALAQNTTNSPDGSEISSPGVEDPLASKKSPESTKPIDAVSEQAPVPEKPKKKVETSLSGAPGQGLSITIGKHYSLNIRSRFQLRYQLDIPDQQSVYINTIRLVLSGHIYRPQLRYLIQLALAPRDFRDDTVSPLFDAFLDWRAHRDFNLRVGQFFIPFDRLRAIGQSVLQMVNRPRPAVELALTRDVGALIYSENFLSYQSPVAWKIGVFGGGGMNLDVGKKPGVLLLGRLEIRPLGPVDDHIEGDLKRRRKPGLALGGAFAANWNTDRLRSVAGPKFAAGTTHYYHATTDLVFKWRGLAVQGEYLWRRASTNIVANEYTRSGQGWIAQLSYLFEPPIEVVGRLSGMYPFEGTDPTFITELDTTAQEMGAGLNYYINGHFFKVQANWIAYMPANFAFAQANHIVQVQLDVTF